jgi:hypothetical protein
MRRPVAASTPEPHEVTRCSRRARFLARALAFRRASSLNRRRQTGVQNSCGRPPERRGWKARPHSGRLQTLGPNVARCSAGLPGAAGGGEILRGTDRFRVNTCLAGTAEAAPPRQLGTLWRGQVQFLPPPPTLAARRPQNFLWFNSGARSRTGLNVGGQERATEGGEARSPARPAKRSACDR